MPDIENNTMSTFTIGGKTYQVEDASARTSLTTTNTQMNELDQRVTVLENGSSGSSITPEQSALIADIPNKVNKNGIGQVTAENNIICSNQSKNLVTARYDGKTISTTVGSWGNIGSYDTASNIGYLFIFPMEEGKTYYFNKGNNLNPSWFTCKIFQYTTKNYEEIGRSTIIGTYDDANFYDSFGSFPKGNSQATEYYSVIGKTGVKMGVFCLAMPKTQPVPDDVVISENRPILYEPIELYKVNPDYIKDFDGGFLKNKVIYWFGDSIVHGLYCETSIAQKIDKLFGSISYNMAVSMKQFYGDGIPSQVTGASAIPPDYIIFNGGANDSNSVLGVESNKSVYNTNPGAMIDDAPNLTYDYGTDTVCGAFETMCQRIRSKYPLAKVFFISTHYIGANHPYAEQKAMYAAFKEICHKWAIPVIDMTNEGNINSYLNDSFTLNTTGNADKTHPSDKAHYEYFIPMIVRKMAESTIDYNE